jgi:hypothetical protein
MSIGPTAASEFRRGLNAYNLMVGVVASLAGGVAALLATALGAAPDVLGLGSLAQALGVGLLLFVVITGLHTATHTYFGWRFARGIRAAESGDHARAARLLAPVERRGMTHYDEGGHARRTLAACRAPRG